MGGNIYVYNWLMRFFIIYGYENYVIFLKNKEIDNYFNWTVIRIILF